MTSLLLMLMINCQASPLYKAGDRVSFVLSQDSGTCHGRILEVREEPYKNYYLIRDPVCPFQSLDSAVEIPQGIIFGVK